MKYNKSKNIIVPFHVPLFYFTSRKKNGERKQIFINSKNDKCCGTLIKLYNEKINDVIKVDKTSNWSNKAHTDINKYVTLMNTCLFYTYIAQTNCMQESRK